MGFRERTPSPYHGTRGSGSRRTAASRLSFWRSPYVLTPTLFLLLFLFVSIVSGFKAEDATGEGQRFDHYANSADHPPAGLGHAPRSRHDGRAGSSLYTDNSARARPGQPSIPENESGARPDSRNENKLLKNIVSHSFLFVCQEELAALCQHSPNKLQCLLGVAEARRVFNNPAENDSRHAHQDAVFSPECVNWLFSRQICMEAVREIALRNASPNCTRADNPRQCLRQVAASLLPPACVHSSYYISVQSAGIVQRRAERSQ